MWPNVKVLITAVLVTTALFAIIGAVTWDRNQMAGIDLPGTILMSGLMGLLIGIVVGVISALILLVIRR